MYEEAGVGIMETGASGNFFLKIKNKKDDNIFK